VFVIVAVFFEKNLQNVANYLVVSLAVADLMVACLVMPLAAVYEVSVSLCLLPFNINYTNLWAPEFRMKRILEPISFV